MRVTHGWYEKDPNADVFKVLSSVTVELSASERWSLCLVLGVFLDSQRRKGFDAGVDFAKNLCRQVGDDPNPNVPFYKDQTKELREKIKELERECESKAGDVQTVPSS